MDDLKVEPLRSDHDRAGFDCGVPALNHYLQRQASQDVRRRVAQVFVVAAPASPERIIGYYGLSAASFDRADLPQDAAKRLPHYPVPAVLLGRLAVDRSGQNQGMGEFLLMDALRRILKVSATLAVHAVIVDVKDANAARFYDRYGFRAFPTVSRRLFLPLDTISRSGL